MDLADTTLASALWRCIETLHAVTYFGDETQLAAKDLGSRGFWMSYFGMRASPLGAASSGLVDATFSPEPDGPPAGALTRPSQRR